MAASASAKIRASFSNLLLALNHQAHQGGLAQLPQRAGSAAAPAAGMVAGSATGNLLRGGRTSADLLPAIGRRLQQRGRGASCGVAPAAGARRQMSYDSCKTRLTVVKNDSYIQIDGSFKPINSLEVLYGLQEKVYKVGYKAQLYRGRQGSLLVLVGCPVLMGYGVWTVSSEQVENKKKFEDLQISTTEIDCTVRKLRLSIPEVENK